MTMDADAAINQAIVRKIDGSFSWIYLHFNIEKLIRDHVNDETLLYLFLTAASRFKDLNFYQNGNTYTFHKTDRSLVRAISDGLISKLLHSFCVLFVSSFFPDDLFIFCGETG